MPLVQDSLKPHVPASDWPMPLPPPTAVALRAVAPGSPRMPPTAPPAPHQLVALRPTPSPRAAAGDDSDSTGVVRHQVMGKFGCTSTMINPHWNFACLSRHKVVLP